jgi:hypothetical protein
MAQKSHSEIEPDVLTDSPMREQLDHATRAVMDGGRAVASQLPGAIEGARGAVGSASAAIDDLSDQGVVAAMALSAGVTIGLFLAGAPRLILALACLPTAIAVRSAMQRGVGPVQLVTPRG